MVVPKDADPRGRVPRKLPLVMAASAAMIVAGVSCVPFARAQDAGEAASASPPPSNSLTLINQIQSLRDQMQQMQGQLEVLQHQVQQLQQTSKDQYVDLDSRVGKLEHAQAAPPASTPAASAAPAPTAAASGAPGKTAPAASSKPASTADKAAAQAEYDAAFKALRAGNFVDSAHGFRTFIDKYPDNPLVPNAYYWLGGSYYVTQNYKVALAAYQNLVQKYPGSARVPEAQLRVADCQIELKDYPAARATLQAMIKAHPGTPLEKRAREKLRDLPAPAGAK
ncbi:MAG: tol-pal system protein YbgF [Rhodanobacteraceae bacterium]|nr:MAG: tol-pal system protein YbgF [Rhodanobacteraceae bacterium]